MALKPVIYKLMLHISDLNRHLYENFNLTVAQHPSETEQRMVSRILAFCLNADAQLTFTKGLSTTEEPDLWQKSLDDQIDLWIEIGEPSVDRIKKSTRLAKRVKVYSFNSKSDVWWTQSESKFKSLDAQYFRFNPGEVAQLAEQVSRTMKWYITISDDCLSVTTETGECDVHVEALYALEQQ